jgi:hypothetical protein
MDPAASRWSAERPASAGSRLRAWVVGGVVGSLAVAAFAGIGIAPAGATASRGAARPLSPVSTATCVVREHVAFKPARVVEGRSAHLVVVLHNCTGSPHTVELTRFGFLVCLVADPINQQITLGAAQTTSIRTRYLAPTCTGTGRITARVTSSTGKQLTSKVAKIEVLAPPPSS